MAKKKKTKKTAPKVHDDLKGFNININEFGEIQTNVNIEKLNTFLNKNVDDKKLRGLEDDEPLEEAAEENDEDILFDENEDVDVDKF